MLRLIYSIAQPFPLKVEWTDTIYLLQFLGPGVVRACWLSGLQGDLNTTEPLLMLVVCFPSLTAVRKGSILRAFYYYSSLKKHFELHLMYLGSLCRCLSIVLYLKGSQSQLDVQSGCHSSALRQECKHGVVHPKQRDEEQSGFSQPSEGNHSQRNKEENIA